MTNEKPITPIYRRAQAPKKATPFEGDLFERKALADRLTALLSRMPDGTVLTIDAAWGEGKTWFGQNWYALLEAAEYRTAYIDCFERDYIDDPFVMIAGELLNLRESGEPEKRRKLVEASKKLAVTLLPSAARFAANTVGHWAIGKADLGDEIAKSMAALEESSASSLEKLVSKRLESYETDKKSVEAFRVALSELAAEGEKPIVVFLDELDRCRPDFAVRTIERMKHFFEVPRVVFVLLINRSQLVAAIKGGYGGLIDGDAYFAKFVQLSLTLPKQASREMNSPDDNQKYCDATLVRFGFGRSEGTALFAQTMGVLATLFKLSLRDVELAVVLYSLAQPLNVSSADAAWPIAIKLSDPDLFARLLRNEQDAHDEAYKLASSLRQGVQSIGQVLQLFEEVHLSGASGFTKSLPDDVAQMIPTMTRIQGPKFFFSLLFGKVDLDVAR